MDDLIKRLQDRAETKLVAYDRSGHKLLFALCEDDYVKEEPADKDCADALARIKELEREVDHWREIAHNEAGEAEHNFETMLNLNNKLVKAVEALTVFARQYHTAEMNEEEYENADFEGAYDDFITKAKDVLAELEVIK